VVRLFFLYDKILCFQCDSLLGIICSCITPNELHKWIKMMLDSYHLNKETDFMDARKMSDPVIIQRLILLKETIEEEYMKQYIRPGEQDEESKEWTMSWKELFWSS
jgi:hypothetical protein